MSTYLTQWCDFNETTCSELTRSTTEKLEGLCSTADVVCDALNTCVQSCDKSYKEISSQSLTMENDLKALKMELSAADVLYREEEATFKNVITARKKKIVETARKSYQNSKREKGMSGENGSRKNTKQLMLALRDL